MAKNRANKSAAQVVAPQVEAQVIEAQVPAAVVEAPAVEAPAKAKPVRYASVAVLSNPAAVVTSVAANPKKVGSKAHAKYSLFEVGQTLAQVEAKFIQAGWPRIKARNELRWDFAHGFITIENPQ